MPLETPDITELKAIVDWANLTPDVRYLSITHGGVELVISRDRWVAPAVTTQPTASAPPPAVAPPRAPETTTVATTIATTPSGAPVATPESSTTWAGELAPDQVLITAPMVGTFYASPKPGDPEFVAVGDAVTASSIVGIVEVMKLMNNLEAKVEGTIAQVLVSNEQAVEYGQPLMVITRNG